MSILIRNNLPNFYLSPKKIYHKANYISSTTKELKDLSARQIMSAKKAINWLLTKGPYTNKEIAEHFGLSIELVNVLVKKIYDSNQDAVKPLREGFCPLGNLSSQDTVK